MLGDYQIQLYGKHIYPSGKVRYYPAEKIYDYDLMSPGHSYLVQHPKGGGISTRPIRQEITPDYASVLLALKELENEAARILLEADKLQPSTSEGNPLTKKEKEAYAAYTKVLGEERQMWFQGISAYNLIQKLIVFLETHIEDQTK